MPSPEDAVLGKIALHYKLVTQDALNAAVQRQGASSKTLGDVLLELKVISVEQLKWLQQAQAQYLAKQAGPSPSAPRAPPSAPSAPAPAPAPAAPPSAPRPQGHVVNLPASAPPPAAIRPAPRAGAITLFDVLAKAVEARASDVHIHSGAPLQMRIGGVLKELKLGQFTPSEVEAIIRQGLTPAEQKILEEQQDYDLALVMPGLGRFRASFYKQQRGYDAVFRPIPLNPPTLGELGLPSSLARLADFHQGLVLFTGPAGSGKSSTLAAIVNMLNESRKDHIITVEDPIEYVYAKKQCVVNQRQAGKHTLSFANALRAALREDPDIIVIGELRDLETIQLAITAAETGHLVLGTLHTNNAIRTINRVLDVFPPKQQSQIRAMVSESLRAIVSQRLIPTSDGARRLPALEVLYVKPAVSNLIREEKTFQIRSIMQTGRGDGMTLLDDSIADLVKTGQVNKETARRFAEDPKRFA
ncbi:MAG: type IV pilus twitching motility protein PilT [Archangium sp.]|nr:type IV pilus twitching motility protein PilT [Archangium sp.]